jgi:hypothetical protein
VTFGGAACTIIATHAGAANLREPVRLPSSTIINNLRATQATRRTAGQLDMAAFRSHHAMVSHTISRE